MYRWEKQLSSGGCRPAFFAEINKYVLQQFTLGVENHIMMHDRDLCRWAIAKAYENAEARYKFKASKKWLYNFKIENSIVSRKVTKFTKRNYSDEERRTEYIAADFVKNFLVLSRNYMPKHIFNTDQCGINIELVSGRTLDFVGTKQVSKTVGSVSATTHSYTIQPIISKDGQLLSPLYVCWQQPKGVFGENVQRDIDKNTPKNLYVVASKSGKLTKPLMVQWFKKVYFPNAPIESILIVDSWTCFNDRKAIDEVKPSHQILNMLQIPPKTTPLIQPLDVGFFRTWKQFMRNIVDHVLLDRLSIKVLYHFS